MQVREFAKLPVVDRGRVKPIDTVARTSLMVISNKQTFRDDAQKEQPAIRWLLDVMTSNGLFRAGTAESLKVFRIENDQLLDFLGLEVRPQNFRYAITEFADKMAKLEDAFQRANKMDPKQRDKFNQKVIELYRHLQTYLQLNQLASPLVVPPAAGSGNDWDSFVSAARDAMQAGRDVPALRSYLTMLKGYADNKPEEFNRAVAEYRRMLEQQMPDDVRRADFEAYFNEFAPFYQCLVLYLFVFLICCMGWIGYTAECNRAAFWLAVITFLVQTWAIAARMYIQGRPPVTNLYSSAVFIGWGILGMALFMERIHRNGLATLVASILGALTMFIAHHLAASGDTLEMMQAVLDTNFWLATHVTCMTLGYSATVFAGFLGIFFILRGVFTKSLDAERFKTLSEMIYGVICFAMLLSFTGTVLGGIWGDQSWGRFWGWDPKENGAVMIVIWNALILHARWGGMVKQRGVAVLAVIGNMITAWSYFGTNQLGVGLHSYGFDDSLAPKLTAFWLTQLAFIGIGLVPLSMWRSFGRPEPSGPEENGSPRIRRDAPVLAGAK
jgi:ABC-type transport system involved in cytochrome c biogenesis permease subunit